MSIVQLWGDSKEQGFDVSILNAYSLYVLLEVELRGWTVFHWLIGAKKLEIHVFNGTE